MSEYDESDDPSGLDPSLGGSALSAGIDAMPAFDPGVQSAAVRSLLESRESGTSSGSEAGSSSGEAGSGGDAPVPGETEAPSIGAEPDLDLLIQEYLGAVSLTGTSGSDTIDAGATSGGDGGARIEAGGGDDTVTGGSGDDLIFGDGADGGATPVGYDDLVSAQGAVAFFRLDEGSGSTAHDAISGNDGTLKKGADFVSDHAYGDSSGSASFDGRNDFLQVAHDGAYELDQGYVQFWFKPDDLDGTQGLFSKDSSGYDDGGHLDISVSGNGTITVRLQSDHHSYYVSSEAGAATNGEWTQVVFGWGDGGMKLYVDGQLVDSDSYGGGIAANEEPITIGASSQYTDDHSTSGVANFFDGEIDAVSIHSGAIDDATAAAYFSAANGTLQVAGSDLLFGADGDDIVIGGEGDDTLSGGSGNDLLAGQGGDDLLVGDSQDGSGTGGSGGSVETNVIEVRLGGTSYQPEDGNAGGDPHYVIRADGEVIAEGYVTWAQSGAFDAGDPASWQTVSVNWQNDGVKPGDITVEFTNDAYGGSSSTDRNLYVDSISVNGSGYDVGWDMNSAGSRTVDTSDAADPVSLATSTVSRTVVDEDFSGGTGDFHYADDAFGGTDQPAYADGSASDGALHVDLGGVDNSDVQGMSGGWTTDFTLDGDASDGTLTFSYRIDASTDYESEEGSAVVVSIDGQLVSSDESGVIDYVNGGGDTGWRTVTLSLSGLAAGQHSLTIGGYNNQKTTASESTRVSIDNVTLNYSVATAGEVLAGNDTLLGGDGNDTLLGNGGDDSLYGGSGDDSLMGGDGNDALSGGDGSDTLWGNGGDDSLAGGLGDDLIYGDGDLSAGGAAAGDFGARTAGTGLTGSLYYGFSDSSVSQAWAHVADHSADATFTASQIDYPQGGNSSEGTAADFLGQDAASLSGSGSQSFQNVAVHLEGWIYIPEGTQSFTVKSDDGFQLKIGDQVLSQFDGDRGFAETTANGTYTEGLYHFDLVYWEHSGAEGLEISASFTDGAPLDGSYLYQSADDSGLQLSWVDDGNGGGHYVVDTSATAEAGALGGNDVIEGGDGADTIYGNEAHDTLFGGAGDDTLYGDGELGGHGGTGQDGFSSELFPTYGHALSNVVLYLADSNGEITKVKIDSFSDGSGEVHDLDSLPLAGFLATEYAGYELVAATIKAGNNGDYDVAHGEGQLVILDSGYARADLPLSSNCYESYAYTDTLGGHGYDAADAAARAGGSDGTGWSAGLPGNDVIDGGDGNDTIFGNEENDTLFGGSGDDLVYGDIASSVRGGSDGGSGGDSGGGAASDGGSGGSELSSDGYGHYGYYDDSGDWCSTGGYYDSCGDWHSSGGSYDGEGNYRTTSYSYDSHGDVCGTSGYVDSHGDWYGGSGSSGSDCDTGEGGSGDGSGSGSGSGGDGGLAAYLGQPGSDIIDGGDGNDTLVGNEFDDTLSGGAGNDVLIGDGSLLAHATLSGTIDATNYQLYTHGTDSTTGAAAAVSWVDSSVGDGFGVAPAQNSDAPIHQETGFNPETYQSETLTIDFGRGVDTAAVHLSSFYVDDGGHSEVALWEAYRDGELVGAGSIEQTDAGASTATLSIDLGGQLFDSIELRGQTYGYDYYNEGVTTDSSDFLVSKVDWTAPEGSDAAGFGSVVGTAGDDTLTGGDGSDTIFGNELDDVLDGGSGNDLLAGGSGNDFLDGWYGDDTLIGGSGDDTVMWDSADSYIRGGDGHDTLVGYDSNDTIFLDDPNFGLGQVANGGFEVVNLGNGDNFLIGDEINQGDTSLTVYGGSGNDWISTWGNGNDEIYGGGGTLDQIWGGAGNDQIYGGDGVDYIYGGAGSDTLTGGADFDVYYVGRGDGSTQIVDDGGQGDFFGESREGNGLVLFWGYNDTGTYEGVGSEGDSFSPGQTLTDASQVSVSYDDAHGKVLVQILGSQDSDNGGATVSFDYGTITDLNFWDVAGGGTSGSEPWTGERDITRFSWDDEHHRFIYDGLDLNT